MHDIQVSVSSGGRRVMSLRHVAKRLGLTYETVRRMAVAGRIPAFKLGRWSVYEDELDSLVKRLQTENAERGRSAVTES